jgi:predicted HicB family RNase H-like nuclease
VLPDEDRRPLPGGRHHEMLLRLDDEMFATLAARARDEHVSLSQVVRAALRVYLCDLRNGQGGGVRL